MLQVPFDEHEIAIGKDGGQLGIESIACVAPKENAYRVPSHDGRRIRTCVTVPEGVLAWLIQFVGVGRMFH